MAQYDTSVFPMANETAYNKDVVWDPYMRYSAPVLASPTNPKLVLLDVCGTHFSNKDLISKCREHGLYTAPGIPGATQFWQPCDQNIIPRFKYHIHEELHKKRDEQELEMFEMIDALDTEFDDADVQDIKSDLKVDTPESRIFSTHAIGSAWKNIMHDDNVILSSWWTSGLTLPIDGSQDSQWKLKMIEKFAGDCKITPELLKRLRIVNAIHDDTPLAKAANNDVLSFIEDSDDDINDDQVLDLSKVDQTGEVNVIICDSVMAVSNKADPSDEKEDVEIVGGQPDLLKVLNGLHNLGNTCYINCVIQIFSIMTPLLNCIGNVTDLSFDSNNQNDMLVSQWMKEQLLLDEFLKLIGEINHSGTGAVNPKTFINHLPSPYNVTGIQRDATEFYGHFIQLIDELCAASTSKPKLIPVLLSFAINTTIKCGDCQRLTGQTENHYRLFVCIIFLVHVIEKIVIC